MSKKQKWTGRDFWEAELIHGPEQNKSDTYRLWHRGTLESPGKFIDVPGWMVGDPEMARIRMHAADIIRERLLSKK